MKFDDLIEYVTNQIYDIDWEKVERITEFALLKECPQSLKWHAEGNAWEHTKKVVEEVYAERLDFAYDYMSRLLLYSALCHDLGKITTTKPDPNKPDTWHSYGHEFESEKIVRELFAEDPLVDKVAKLVRNHMAVLTLLDKKSPYEEIIKMVNEIGGKDMFDVLVALKRCDLEGSIQSDKIHKHADFLRLQEIQKIADVLYGEDVDNFVPHTRGNFNYEVFLRDSKN